MVTIADVIFECAILHHSNFKNISKHLPIKPFSAITFATLVWGTHDNVHSKSTNSNLTTPIFPLLIPYVANTGTSSSSLNSNAVQKNGISSKSAFINGGNILISSSSSYVVVASSLSMSSRLFLFIS